MKLPSSPPPATSPSPATGPPPATGPSLAERVASIRARIETAACAAGRAPDAIRLIAVSKGQPVESIQGALCEGITDFGENYAQELLAKAAALAAVDPPPLWHYQGTLQRRKVRDLLPVVATFQSVARTAELDEIAGRATAKVECLIEVNIGGEPRKNGVLPEHLGALVDHAAKLERICVLGLMTVPPEDEQPERWFAALRELAAGHGLAELSMGMSSDFEAAIRQGATIVRIGAALFGPRRPRAIS